MSTLAEIEKAASQLPPEEQDELIRYLSGLRRTPSSASVTNRKQEWMNRLAALAGAISTGQRKLSADEVVSELREERL